MITELTERQTGAGKDRLAQNQAEIDGDALSVSLEDVAKLALDQLGAQAGGKLNVDPATVERDLTRLVLTLIEFLRQLLEAQAVRRMEKGRLTPEQEERLGETLMLARERLVAVAAEFGVSEEELTLDLGPFGRLV